MAKSSVLLPFLPHTRPMGRGAFTSLLKAYGKVIVKPTRGWGGDGVISITSRGGNTYEIQDENRKTTRIGLQSAYSFLQGKTKGSKHYIVQQKIPLAKIKERPFDVRVMIQRKNTSGWTVTGALAKVAGAGYFITNVARSKGRVVPLSAAIQQSNIQGASPARIEQQIDQIALTAAKQLQRYYRIHTVGLDVGIDTMGKVWIIEANFTPSIALFYKLKDKSMHRRILSYARK